MQPNKQVNIQPNKQVNIEARTVSIFVNYCQTMRSNHSVVVNSSNKSIGKIVA